MTLTAKPVRISQAQSSFEVTAGGAFEPGALPIPIQGNGKVLAKLSFKK